VHIFVVGLDHSTAPIEVRERLVCSPEQVLQVLARARQVFPECVLLSTCNRVELYAVCPEENEARAALLQALSEVRQVPLSEFEACCYDFADERAVGHLFSVASGLSSLVPGEAQIQGQVAKALEVARGYAGPITSALFRAALVAGKRARSETGISRNPASVSQIAVQLACQFFPQLPQISVLLIGTGQMSELSARNLYDHGVRRLFVVNRTPEHAAELARRFGAVCHSFADLPAVLTRVDVVISSTTAPHAIITSDLLQKVMRQREGRMLLLIDIALPRDVDPAVASLPGIYLYNLDDLQETVNEGIRLRMREMEHVEAIITEEVQSFERWLRSLSVIDTVSDLRQRVDMVRQQELARTMRQLSASLSEREMTVVQELTTRLMNKFLHTPTVRLKDAATAGQGQLYAEVLRYLFDLEEIHHDEANHDRHAGQYAGNDPDSIHHRAAAPALADPGDAY
jgi:glutamyl-tRNA reductase